MPPSRHSCSVCHRLRTGGSFEAAHGVFICAECERDAKQYIEIQDSIWGKAGDDDEDGTEPAVEA